MSHLPAIETLGLNSFYTAQSHNFCASIASSFCLNCSDSRHFTVQKISSINSWLVVALMISVKLVIGNLLIMSLSLSLKLYKKLLHLAFSFSIDPRDNLSNCKNFWAYSITELFPWLRLLSSSSRALCQIIGSRKYWSFNEIINSNYVIEVRNLHGS